MNKKCKKCGSYAFNLDQEGIDQGEFCDRHYWQDRAEKAEQVNKEQEDRRFKTMQLLYSIKSLKPIKA